MWGFVNDKCFALHKGFFWSYSFSLASVCPFFPALLSERVSVYTLIAVATVRGCDKCFTLNKMKPLRGIRGERRLFFY